MWDFKIGTALGLMMRTLPFIGLRLLVYVGITFGYLLVTGMGAGIGYGIGSMGGTDARAVGALWGGIIGFAVFGGLMYWAREYILYLVKAGHIAVLVELIDGKDLPAGKSQLSHGTAVVKQRFAQSSVLFAVDRLIKGVVRAISGMARGVLTALPLPGMQQLAGMVQAFLRVALGFVDELILAWMIRSGSTEPWGSARDSLILYGQNYKVMLKNAAWLALMIYGLGLLIFLVMLIPAGLLVYLLPGTGSVLTLVIALLLAWSIKAGILEPFAITCMMQVYFKAIDGQQPNPEWDARLDKLSGKFRKLKQRALGTVGGADSAPDATREPEVSAERAT